MIVTLARFACKALMGLRLAEASSVSKHPHLEALKGVNMICMDDMCAFDLCKGALWS